MKPKPTTEKPAVAVTTKVRLTFKGQTFDLSMEELRELHNVIGAVVIPHDRGKTEIVPNQNMLEEMKRIREEGAKGKQRPIHPPWPVLHPPSYWTISPPPYLDPYSKPMCRVSDSTGSPLPEPTATVSLIP